MSRPLVSRRPRWPERPWIWLLGTAFTFFFIVVLALGSHTGGLEGLDALIFSRTVRGHTVLGLATGVLATFLFLAVLAYSLRKRTWQEHFPVFRSSMMTWLWAHVAFGIMALIIVSFHGGFGLFSFEFSTGKIAYVTFALLVATGIVWRLVYGVVPPRAAPRIGNYAVEGSAKRAEEQLTEIEKIAAGRSAPARELKDAVLAHRIAPGEVAARAAQFAPEERAALEEIARLAASRDRALERQRLQERYSTILQSMRVLHIPLTILFVPALVLHVVFALDLPAAILPKKATPPVLSGFETADGCASCHKTIYEQWRHSMHAHAMRSPMMITQTNQLTKVELAKQPSPDPRGVCVNCHGPAGVSLSDDVTLPLKHSLGGDDLMNEGISCSVCHQYQGPKPAPGSGGLSRWQSSLKRGSVYYGPIRDPVGNAHHQSELGSVFKNPDDLCVGCHNVSLDRTGDGKVTKGEDLVLQVTDEEYLDYRAGGGDQTCITCHMPRMQTNRVAEAASIPFEQDREAPARQVHDHSFVGVDYPLDEIAKGDPQRPIREALLRSAATIDLPRTTIAVRGGNLSFDVTITNSGTGHNLPTGFAFARQMWLEITVSDPTGPIFASGVLATPSSDLCDAGTLDEASNPMRPFMNGCDRSDPQLVNFQKKLVNHFEIAKDKQGQPLRNDKGELKIIQAESGQEQFLQYLTSGVVERIRPSDGKPTAALKPGETRSFHYVVPLPARALGELALSARLLFRNNPPYFVRAMGEHQPPGEQPRLGPLVTRLMVVQMAQVKQTVGPHGP
jgi:hypothetical protein